MNPRRPRILLLADRPGWAYDTTARAVAAHLGGEFEFRITHVLHQPDLSEWPFDVLFVFFWGETYHQQFALELRRVIKGISSHRWAEEEAWGLLSPLEMKERFLRDAGTLAASSRRLQSLFTPYGEVWLIRNGFEPREFCDQGTRAGGLRIGWAGNEADPCKGLDDILRPAVGRDFDLRVAGGSLSRDGMVHFYNSIDVLCVASTAEGQPLPLIEGMACGCFPVCVDVGIVPELVKHGENGLIVRREAAAFRAAFYWCKLNVDLVRERGRENAGFLVRERAWAETIADWRRLFQHAVAKAGTNVMPAGGHHLLPSSVTSISG